MLRGHTGLVKGVTWDPVGRYLTSQADDKSLRIWRTSDWTTEERIVDPFADVSVIGSVVYILSTSIVYLITSSHR